MVNNYTPNLKRRSNDLYSPGGIPKRPDRARSSMRTGYTNSSPMSRSCIGGIEASLRRFAHYDYWQDRVRQSILADAPADLLVFGMGERQVVEIASRIAAGEPVGSLRNIRGTSYTIGIAEWRNARPEGVIELPGFPEVSRDKTAYARAFALHCQEQDPMRGRPVGQPHPKTIVIQNPPARPLTPGELDHIYELPFTRSPAPLICAARPGAGTGQVLGHQPSRLFWRVLLLRNHAPPGPDHPEPEHRLDYPGGDPDDENAGIPWRGPGYRGPDSEYVRPLV